MKRLLWSAFITVVLITLLMISCVRKGTVPHDPPIQQPVVQADGVVTLSWQEVNSATSYDIEIVLISPETGERLVLGRTEGVQSGETLVIQTSGRYRWRVRARNENGVGPWSDWNEFDGIPKASDLSLTLEISEEKIYECESVIATVTSFDKAIDKVKLLARKTEETHYTYETVYRRLDENNQATFTIDKKRLENNLISTRLSCPESKRQVWVINAQGNGNATKSDERELEIRFITVNPKLSVQLNEKEVKDGQYVCLDPDEEFPVEAVYTVDIDFIEDAIGSKISELGWNFEYAGAYSEMLLSAGHIYNPFDFSSWETEEISLNTATECTKHATLTVWGTACSDESVIFSETVTLDFTIDGALPEVSLDFIPDTLWNAILEGATDTITLSFAASDTKSLCEATLSIFVYKVDEKEEQMPGWEQVEVPWGVEEFTIGTGDNKMIGKVEYSGNLGIPDIQGTASIGGTLTLQSMGVLDFAPVFATFTAIDCCNAAVGCDECGNPVKRKPVEAQLLFEYVLYDNAFFMFDLKNIDFIHDNVQGYEELGDSWLLTSLNPTGTATVVSIDFSVWFPEVIVKGDRETVEATILWNDDYEDYLAVCTGYPWKEAYYDLLIIEATENVEGVIDIEVFNVDKFFNMASLTKNIIIDTMPPSLTSVQGVKKHLGPGNDAIQFSFREEDEQQGVVPLGATVTVNDETLDIDSRFLPVYYSKEFIKRLSEESTVWTIDPLAKSVALNPSGTIKLEILAKDCYGNLSISDMSGRIID